MKKLFFAVVGMLSFSAVVLGSFNKLDEDLKAENLTESNDAAAESATCRMV